MNRLADVINLSPGRTRQLVFIGLGFALLATGFVIMATPVLTGLALWLIGGYILLRNSVIAKRLFIRFKLRHPDNFRWMDRMRRRRRR